MNRKFPLYLLTGLLIAALSFSCSSDSEEYYESSVESGTAITAFSLLEDDDVMENLDSVFFTIDLNNGLIYNADSLPVGTDVSKLRVDMTYVTCSSAQFHVTGGEWMNDTTFVYSDSESDSIDFTGDVKFTIVSQDLSAKQTYTIKVNVHKVEPDSLYWSRLARRDLPVLSSYPQAQKTEQMGDVAYCLVKETSGYVLSSTADPASNSWEKASVSFAFVPKVETFTAAETVFYILDENNALYQSTNGLDWTATGEIFYSISGAYGDRVLGVAYEGGVYVHTEYPMSDGFAKYEVAEDFPVAGVSPMVTLTSKWAVSEQHLIVGGVTASGNYTGKVWGYDGENWGLISRVGIAPAKGVTMVAYPYSYFDESAWKTYEYPALIAMGGTLDGGKELNDSVYISIDNGITWKIANDCLQLPSYIERFTGAQALVYNSTLSDNAARSIDGWEMLPTPRMPASLRVRSRATEAITEWECPYIYVFGGTTLNGSLHNNIWRGAINRLTFKPLY